MPVIITRPLAGSDLVEIWGYIAEDNEAQADAFIDTLDRKIHILAERPNMGRPRDELAKDLRSFPVGRYVIFYIPLADGVEIVRVLHGARDLDALFNPDSDD
ncbi:MAG: type II toxin-antitoxin system RelE/ParE family toxin [Pseudomonadota bacterium]